MIVQMQGGVRKRVDDLANIKAAPEIMVRIHEIAEKNSAGVITADERTEYEGLVHLGDLMTEVSLRASRFA